jgi:putative RecB family exonuclease
VQLLYLRQPVAILTEPTDQSTRGTRRTLAAVWQAVERACSREDFRPKPSRLCDYCAFQAYCPSFGGDPAEARAVSLALHGDPLDPGARTDATPDEPALLPAAVAVDTAAAV